MTPHHTGAAGDLRRLSDLRDFEVAKGYPDIRGWSVKTPDGHMLGKVDDLIVSMSEMRVRYLDVDVDRSLRSAVADVVTPVEAERGHALVPIGTAKLDDKHDDVIVSSLPGGDLAAYPRYAREQGITRDYEDSVRGRYVAGGAASGAAAAASDPNYYTHEHYDERRAFESRRAAAAQPAAPVQGAADVGSIPPGHVVVRREIITEIRPADGTAAQAGASGAADRATSGGIADRITDRVDDVKDRVDANPASRPGPDSTDRRI